MRLAAKLKQLWWLMLVFAICNVVIAVMLYQGNQTEEPKEVTYIPKKDMYDIGILQEADLPETNKMTDGVMAALHAGE